MEKPFLSVKDVAKRFQVSTSTVYRLIDEGRLKFSRVRTMYRVSIEEVARYMKENNMKL